MPSLDVRSEFDAPVKYLVEIDLVGHWSCCAVREDTGSQVPETAWSVLRQIRCNVSRVPVVAVAILGRRLEVHKL